MPHYDTDEEATRRAHQDERAGKSASTQAGEFVREEMHHVREGKHGARSPQQVIAIGLSKARRAGVKLNPPKGGSHSKIRRQAERDLKKGRSAGRRRTSRARSRASLGALKREGRSSAAHAKLSRQAQAAARRRGSNSRPNTARKAARSRAKNR